MNLEKKNQTSEVHEKSVFISEKKSKHLEGEDSSNNEEMINGKVMIVKNNHEMKKKSLEKHFKLMFLIDKFQIFFRKIISDIIYMFQKRRSKLNQP